MNPPPSVPPTPSAQTIEDLLVQRLAALRQRPPAEIDPTRPFNELGIDSLDAITLADEVERRLGLTIDPAELFDHPTPRDLAAHLGRRSHGSA